MNQDSSSGLIQNKTHENTLQDAEELNNLKVARATGKSYKIQCTFDSLKAAREKLDRQKCDNSYQKNCLVCEYSWTILQTTQVKNGEKRWYKCRCKNCPCRLQLSCSSTCVILSVAGEHSHEIDIPTSTKINKLIE